MVESRRMVRDHGWDELFLVYRGHVLFLQRSNSLFYRLTDLGTHGNVPSKQSCSWAPAFMIEARCLVYRVPCTNATA